MQPTPSLYPYLTPHPSHLQPYPSLAYSYPAIALHPAHPYQNHIPYTNQTLSYEALFTTPTYSLPTIPILPQTFTPKIPSPSHGILPLSSCPPHCHSTLPYPSPTQHCHPKFPYPYLPYPASHLYC